MTTEEMICSDGYIQNNDLWRRWILIQIYRSIQHANNPDQKLTAFQNSFFKIRPLRYVWNSTLQEIHVLSELHGKELIKRERFFSFDTILQMLTDHAEHLIPTDKTITCRISHHMAAADKAKRKQSYDMLYKTVNAFIKECLNSLDKSYRSPAWKQAFQCAGAYHAMDNLIKFYGCQMLDQCDYPCSDTSQSLQLLERLTDECTNKLSQEKADCMFHTLLHLMDANHFDLHGKEAMIS